LGADCACASEKVNWHIAVQGYDHRKPSLTLLVDDVRYLRLKMQFLAVTRTAGLFYSIAIAVIDNPGIAALVIIICWVEIPFALADRCRISAIHTCAEKVIAVSQGVAVIVKIIMTHFWLDSAHRILSAFS